MKPQCGFDHGTGGTFAVGSCYMYNPGRILRIPESVENGTDGLEPKLDRFNLITEGIEELH
jgi:hypothetical protein